MPAAYYTNYPYHLVTPELIDRIKQVDHESGYDAGLAAFKSVVGDDPWFQNPERAESGYSRLESEFLHYITDEHIAEFASTASTEDLV